MPVAKLFANVFETFEDTDGDDHGRPVHPRQSCSTYRQRRSSGDNALAIVDHGRSLRAAGQRLFERWGVDGAVRRRPIHRRERRGPERRRAQHRAERRRGAGRPSTGGTSPPATRARADFQAIADAYTAAHPNVHDQDHGPRERGVQDQAGRDPGRRLSGPVPVVGRRDHGRAGRRRPAQGHHGRHLVVEGHDQSRRPEHLLVQRQAVRRAVGHGHDRLLVQQEGLRGRRHHRSARDLGRRTSPTSTKLKASGIAPLAIAGKDKWPSMHLWTYLVLRTGGGAGPQPDDPERQLEHRRLHQGRRRGRRPQRARPVPGRLQVRRLQRRGSVGRQRQGRHGADGPVGAVGPEGPERRQEGPRR